MPNLDRSVVQALPVFSAMGEAELDNAIAHARAQRIPKGAAVFRQGERAESFFVLLHGRLKVVKVTPHGQQMIIRFVKATSMVSPKRSAARTIGLLRAQS
jgi:CRP-like cAMP-binding protein